MEQPVTLAEAFAGGTRKTKWQGGAVYSVYSISVKDGDVLTVTRTAASSQRAQALKLGVDRGNLRANGVLANTAAIWTPTSPDIVTLQVVGKRARSIDLWNAWSLAGVDTSWVGNAGMLIDADGSHFTVRCSDGLGEPKFDDLIATIAIRRG